MGAFPASGLKRAGVRVVANGLDEAGYRVATFPASGLEEAGCKEAGDRIARRDEIPPRDRTLVLTLRVRANLFLQLMSL